MKIDDITITIDQDPDNPRDWGNITTMWLWHRRYNLGDKKPKEIENTNNFNEVLEYIQENYGDFKYLPITLYEHSGITISADSSSYPYNCPWDSSFIGLIFISDKHYRDELNNQNLTKDEIEKYKTDNKMDDLKIMLSDIEIYDLYITGEVYGVIDKRIYEYPYSMDHDLIGKRIYLNREGKNPEDIKIYTIMKQDSNGCYLYDVQNVPFDIFISYIELAKNYNDYETKKPFKYYKDVKYNDITCYGLYGREGVKTYLSEFDIDIDDVSFVY